MKDLIILGAGGLGQEIAWLVEEINEHKKEWNLLGFLDAYEGTFNTEVLGYPVLGPHSLSKKYRDAYFTMGYGDARLRRKTVEEVAPYNLKWANLYSPTVRIHHTNKIGTGVVIGRYSDLTVHCEIGNFVMLNIHVVLGHSVKVGDYTIISPNVTVNGNATIEHTCQIGANSFIKEVTIGDHVLVDASSCVIKDVEPDCVVAGVPAKILHKGKANRSISKSERDEK